jgi:hypothetical protein
MCQVILLLIAFMQQAQMVLGAADVVIGRPPDPVIIRMAGRTIAHDAGNYAEGLGKWFHCDSFGAVRGQGVITDMGVRLSRPVLIARLPKSRARHLAEGGARWRA